MKKQLLTAVAAIFMCNSVFGTTHTVSSPADSGPGSLRDAITNAISGDVIQITTNDTIKLTTGEITISKDLTIQPSGKGLKTISGNNSSRIFTISASYTVDINSLSLVHGSNNNGAAIYTSGTLNLDRVNFIENKAVQKGGAIYVAAGTMTVTYCNFEENSIYNTQNLNTYIPHGGGIYNEGTTNISYSSFYANSCESASWTIGGGVCNAGLMTIENSTFGNNTLKSSNSNYACIGAAIAGVDFGGTTSLDVKSCTVINNSIITGADKGAGIAGWQAETFKINNTIVTNNTFDPTGVASDVHCGQGSTKTSMGYNLIGSTNNFTTVASDTIATASLGAYALNGGSTKNYLIECSTLGYNIGDPSLAGTVSQNGVTRDSHPDIGAFEEPTVLTNPTIIGSDAVCNGESTGSAEITDANPWYNYFWENGDNGNNMTNVGAGEYTVITMDANSCMAFDTVAIGEPSAIMISATVVHDAGNSLGSVSAIVTGGTGPYIYSWDNGEYTASIDSLAQGDYTITVNDANGCQAVKLYSVNSTVNVKELMASGKLAYPNPAIDQLNINRDIKIQSVAIYALDGTRVYQGNESSISLNNFSSGSYYVSITTTNSQILNTNIIVK